MADEQGDKEPQSDRILENEDGTIVVRLIRPVKVDGEEYSRVTIREMTGRQQRLTEKASDGEQGTLTMDIANELSDPAGIADLTRCQQDLTNVMEATLMQVGKFQESGAPS